MFSITSSVISYGHAGDPRRQQAAGVVRDAPVVLAGPADQLLRGGLALHDLLDPDRLVERRGPTPRSSSRRSCTNASPSNAIVDPLRCRPRRPAAGSVVLGRAGPGRQGHRCTIWNALLPARPAGGTTMGPWRSTDSVTSRCGFPTSTSVRAYYTEVLGLREVERDARARLPEGVGRAATTTRSSSPRPRATASSTSPSRPRRVDDLEGYETVLERYGCTRRAARRPTRSGRSATPSASTRRAATSWRSTRRWRRSATACRCTTRRRCRPTWSASPRRASTTAC